jgi:hypothetical protein
VEQWNAWVQPQSDAMQSGMRKGQGFCAKISQSVSGLYVRRWILHVQAFGDGVWSLARADENPAAVQALVIMHHAYCIACLAGLQHWCGKKERSYVDRCSNLQGVGTSGRLSPPMQSQGGIRFKTNPGAFQNKYKVWHSSGCFAAFPHPPSASLSLAAKLEVLE